MKNTKMRNQLELWLFCAIIGAFAGGLVWALLKVLAVGTEVIWEWIPGRFSIPFYTIAVCTIGAAIIGLFRKKYGDYPEEMETVMGKVKKEKHYEYKNMLVMIIAALLPLLIGSSIGPEAGLTGIIVGLCYWAGDNLKFAKQHTKEYSQVGVAASLSVLFHAPLFGIFEVEESESEEAILEMSGTSKVFIYGIALAAATGVYAGLSALFGAGLSGFPAFSVVEVGRIDYVLMIIYIICGCILAVFYEKTHQLMQTATKEQMGILMKEYMNYLPLALIGVAFLKILLTNLCIQSGLKGGHFFPIIFAGVCMGYGIAMLLCGNVESHMVFATAIVTAALLGGTMKKPLAVTMLLFLCYPVKWFVWIFVAAAAGSKGVSVLEGKKE